MTESRWNRADREKCVKEFERRGIGDDGGEIDQGMKKRGYRADEEKCVKEIEER